MAGISRSGKNKIKYHWEKGLLEYTGIDKIKMLRQLVNDRIEKGRVIKWLMIFVDAASLALLIILVGILDVLQMKTDPRIGLINGIVAFELALVTFFSPIKAATIGTREINDMIGILVTSDISKEIVKTVEEKTSGIEKWFALFGGIAIFATLIMKLIT